MHRSVVAVLGGLGVIFIAALVLNGRNSKDVKNHTAEPRKNRVNIPNWDGVVANITGYLPFCEDVFTKTTLESLPIDVQQKQHLHEEYHKSIVPTESMGHSGNIAPIKSMGHSGNIEEQSLMYYHLGSQPFVKTVCEVGFNAGHSAFHFLSGNTNSKMYSFDIGIQPYSRPMATYLNQTLFPGRLVVTWGDSMVTLPRFVSDHPDVACDIVVVDGLHTRAAVISDLTHLYKISTPGGLFIIDDANPGGRPYQRKVMTGYNKVLQRGIVRTLFHCVLKTRTKSGFLVGKFV